jgi:phosphate transport system substrate-binding protein
VEWPVGIGAKGNEGVANNVQNTKGSIGYVEYAYAKQNKLTTVNATNKDGKKVEPNLTSFGAAAQSANWEAEKGNGFGIMLTDQPGAGSWPIAGEALKFFAWAYAKGDKMAEDLDYLPLPQSAKAVIQKVWAAEVKDASGKPVYAMSQ